MKKMICLFLCIVTLAALAIPPWNMEWKESGATVPQAETLKPDRFVGWHDWSFITEEHSQTIAWDGVNSGGKIGYQGIPSLAYDIFLGEISVLILSFLGLRKATRKKKNSS